MVILLLFVDNSPWTKELTTPKLFSEKRSNASENSFLVSPMVSDSPIVSQLKTNHCYKHTINNIIVIIYNFSFTALFQRPLHVPSAKTRQTPMALLHSASIAAPVLVLPRTYKCHQRRVGNLRECTKNHWNSILWCNFKFAT